MILENMAHAGTENGNLVVTYADFAEFGVREPSISAAIREVAARGFLIITEKGKPSNGRPTRYALGWLPMRDGAAAPNRWKAWRPNGPYNTNIESTYENVGRGNGANPRKGSPPLPTKTYVGKGPKSAKIKKSLPTKTYVGKMNLAGLTEGLI